MSKPSNKLLKQYDEFAKTIESEGLEYGLMNGYFNSDTEDEKLNDAIKQAEIALKTIDEIISPYKI